MYHRLTRQCKTVEEKELDMHGARTFLINILPEAADYVAKAQDYSRCSQFGVELPRLEVRMERQAISGTDHMIDWSK